MEQPEQDSSEQLLTEGERFIFGGGDGGRFGRPLGGSGIGDIRWRPRPAADGGGGDPMGDGPRRIGRGGGGLRSGGGEGETGKRLLGRIGEGLRPRCRGGGGNGDRERGLRLRRDGGPPPPPLPYRPPGGGGLPWPPPESESELLASSSMYIFLKPVWRQRFGSFSSASRSFLSQVSFGKARALRITLSISLRLPAGWLGSVIRTWLGFRSMRSLLPPPPRDGDGLRRVRRPAMGILRSMVTTVRSRATRTRARN